MRGVDNYYTSTFIVTLRVDCSLFDTLIKTILTYSTEKYYIE